MARVLESAVRRFTVEEYHRMAETGILKPDERVELLGGVIHEMSPKNWAHVMATRAVFLELERALRGRSISRLRSKRRKSIPSPSRTCWYAPTRTSGRTDRGGPGLFWSSRSQKHRWTMTSVRRQGCMPRRVPEYWVLNLIDRVLVVFLEPVAGSYRHRLSLDETARVTPGPWPELSFEISKFLPAVD